MITTSDSTPLVSSAHPLPVYTSIRWLDRVIAWIVRLFRRPRLTESNLAPAAAMRRVEPRQSITLRRRVTAGDFARKLAAQAPEGFSLSSINWKKRKAKFVGPGGRREFMGF